ncbi:MAG: hypothetical protein IMZ59_06520 [Actinobacteria bacterium]|nr:hypothetical protein [Actinomycetota bacterium]
MRFILNIAILEEGSPGNKNDFKKIFLSKMWKRIRSRSKPCPFCGSANRNIKIAIEERIVIRENLKARQKRKGFRKFIREIIQGWFPSGDKRKHPEGINKTRIIDKEKDSYQEKVKDVKTGKITRNIEEPLSKHRH